MTTVLEYLDRTICFKIINSREKNLFLMKMSWKNFREYSINKLSVILIEGDITEVKADAIVLSLIHI